MPNGEEFYLEPIALGYFRYPDLLDGSIHIEHIDEINYGIAVRRENELRLREKK
jgi:hypothetical protein